MAGVSRCICFAFKAFPFFYLKSYFIFRFQNQFKISRIAEIIVTDMLRVIAEACPLGVVGGMFVVPVIVVLDGDFVLVKLPFVETVVGSSSKSIAWAEHPWSA